MKYNDNGTYKDIYVKAFDTLPVGTEVDYDGATVPSGWTEIPDYSTSEVKIGTWINGKPLYRRVFTGTTSSSSSTTTIAATANFGHLVVKYNGYVVKSSNGAKYNIGGFSSSSNTFTFPYQSSTNNLLLYVSDYDTNTYDYTLIVEYTKTTD